MHPSLSKPLFSGLFIGHHITSRVMAFNVYKAILCTHDAHINTTQCGAVYVCNVNFYACDTHTTTNQRGAFSGSPQLLLRASSIEYELVGLCHHTNNFTGLPVKAAF